MRILSGFYGKRVHFPEEKTEAQQDLIRPSWCVLDPPCPVVLHQLGAAQGTPLGLFLLAPCHWHGAPATNLCFTIC
ncbi:hypothetical protein H920_19348 [Fukomys damarensis]|uniref:Uncharacterized protein n=1 Tax=Fukomys damarensis TaxID=885580 RepID=A0A091CKR9_FUKDA|nr:hypothetical protein H920_19348 [Fukomys damarensis]